MRRTLFGCDVDALTMEESLQRIEEFIQSGKPHQHVVVNVNKVVKASKDPGLRSIINNCALINCDGMPVVWASRLLGKPLPERVAGIDLFLNLTQRAAKKGWRVFFLGAREEVVSKVVHVFTSKYPELYVAGFRNGYWTASDESDVVTSIAAAKPDILFVAISSPKKEQFLSRYQADMRVPFAMGVGGSFDVIAGLTSRAPKWMQQSGLEWFYRFLQEPRRMFKRYFVEGIQFIHLMAREWIAMRNEKKTRFP